MECKKLRRRRKRRKLLMTMRKKTKAQGKQRDRLREASAVDLVTRMSLRNMKSGLSTSSTTRKWR
jgi:hypothetical protein